MVDLRALLRQERKALAADLEAIDEAAWETPSLCPGWTVRDVLAHMTALARMTPPMYFKKLVASGFNLGRLQARDIALERECDPAETLSRFRAVTASTRGLRAVPPTLALGETLLHAEDIRRPLGIGHEYPLAALVTVADAYKGSNVVVGTKRRITGLTLRATDTDWSTGTGPVVSGSMLALVMAMGGRLASLAALEGEGAETLRSRI